MTSRPDRQEIHPPWKRRMCAFADRFEALLNFIIAIMLAVLVTALIYQVFGRYVINRAPSWTEELARFMVVYITMIGAAAIIRRDGHVAVTVLLDSLSERSRQAMMWLRDAIVLSAAGFLIWYGYGFALIGSRRLSPAFEISMYWPFLAIPLGGVLLATFLFLKRIDPRYADRRPEPEEGTI